ncbi:ECF RNA polymerase sigma factor SigJ [Nocardioides dokdonensis FR1436]|uniref:ECF RNA polymerase sigma factor SigJ n=1 Tax=Nocardioides dokdonensis FR1436 TaxID=1300347 RepID=A0A1A9GLT5_9ACTN|nr:sigma-70 family RNA polymerase sigma factor [Nocardioides dokdonensis]ANH39234.1 ECF RNA polymerase sigma factor SigJ [Nocardioides dokdonensis FR1436]
MDRTEQFEAERSRLVTVATRVLGDPGEAEDVVQQAWLRLHRTDAEIENLAGWLTTVTGRLCLDRLRSRTPLPHDGLDPDGPVDGRAAPPTDPADEVALADTVGVALHVVLERLSPRERVAFVLHDSFGFPFETVAATLGTTTVAARKLASRARAKVAQPAPEDALAGWEVVDAFMSAARGGDLTRLLALLAPDALVVGDDAAVGLGTPARITGRREVASFFDGAARAALPVVVDGRPGAAWYDRGVARVLFDFTVDGGLVRRIDFRADPTVLARTSRRPTTPRGPR